MADDGKRSEVVSTKLTERMFIDIGRLAAHDDRSLSDFLFMVIRKELYGRTVKLGGELVDLQDHTK